MKNEAMIGNSLIPTMSNYEPSYLIDELDYVDNEYYIEWLRKGLVGHLDLIRWEIDILTKEDRKVFVKACKDVFRDVSNVHDGAYPDYRYKHGAFERQTLIKTDSLGLCLNWKRDYRRQPKKIIGAEIVAYWNKKSDYNPYHDHLRKIEEIMTILGLKWRLSFVELAQDSVSPDVGSYTFKHMVLKNGNSDQLMWWDDKANKMKAGTNRRANNHYQNNNKSVKQLCCHIKTRPEDYFDEDLQSYIQRAELRLKKSLINKYGKAEVDTIIKNQEAIWNDHVQWRQVHKRQLRKIRMSFDKRKELEDGFAIHAVNQLIQKGLSNSEARRRFTIPIIKLDCKYLQ